MIYGVIMQFDEFGSLVDQIYYCVWFELKFVDFNWGVMSWLFQKQFVEEIVIDMLCYYGYCVGVDFLFKLCGEYKWCEYIIQYYEMIFVFIQCICVEEGIWFCWEQKKDYVVIVFGDDLDVYVCK